jgi:hypothetical protein
LVRSLIALLAFSEIAQSYSLISFVYLCMYLSSCRGSLEATNLAELKVDDWLDDESFGCGPDITVQQQQQRGHSPPRARPNSHPNPFISKPQPPPRSQPSHRRPPSAPRPLPPRAPPQPQPFSSESNFAVHPNQPPSLFASPDRAWVTHHVPFINQPLSLRVNRARANSLLSFQRSRKFWVG